MGVEVKDRKGDVLRVYQLGLYHILGELLRVVNLLHVALQVRRR